MCPVWPGCLVCPAGPGCLMRPWAAARPSSTAHDLPGSAWPLCVPVGGGPPARSPHASLTARSGRSRGPPWPCRHPRAPRPCPATTHGHRSQALLCPPDPPAPSSPVWSSVLRTIHITAEPTPNVARNSPTTLSNPGIRSLELQRFQTLLKLLPIELRATFLGQAPATAHGHRILALQALQALRRPPHLWGLVCCWLAQRVSTSHAVQSSPCMRKTCQKGPFWASRASFVPRMR